jgi:hypothetical protein
MNKTEKTDPKLIYKKISESAYMDIFVISLIIIVSIITDFPQKTWVTQELFGVTYNVPAGYLAVISTILSIISVRLITKRNNIGNFMQIFTPILSMYLAWSIGGNKAAFITYPVTMIINYLVYKTWKEKNKTKTPRKIDPLFFLAVTIGFVISFILNVVGFMYLGKSEASFSQVMNNPLFWTFVMTAGLAIGGNIASIRMYSGLWIITIIYIIIRLSQAIITTPDKPEVIWPEVVKYSVYLVNAVFAYIAWKVTEKIHKNRST